MQCKRLQHLIKIILEIVIFKIFKILLFVIIFIVLVIMFMLIFLLGRVILVSWWGRGLQHITTTLQPKLTTPRITAEGEGHKLHKDSFRLDKREIERVHLSRHTGYWCNRNIGIIARILSLSHITVCCRRCWSYFSMLWILRHISCIVNPIGK